MWPLLLDSSEEECMKTLRRLELEAYGNLVSALRAQGGLTTEKLKILKDTASVLHITPERHRAEIRRAVNDEQLCTIAQFAEGPDTYAEWSVEGRRKVRLVPRVAPQTAFLAVARRVADIAQADNAKMPWPAQTARPPVVVAATTKAAQLKYEPDENRIGKKRRRLSQDSLSTPTSLQSTQPPASPSYTPSATKHRLQKHGISKIQQMYKNQSRVKDTVLMAPPRATIKTLQPVVKQHQQQQQQQQQQRLIDVKTNTQQIDDKFVAKVIATPTGGSAKNVIKITQTQSSSSPQPHQKLVIVSASQTINTTNKIVAPLKLDAATAGGDLKPKVISNQVIVSKNQLTPLQTIQTGDKPKVLTVQAKVRPQGSIIVPLQGQNTTTGNQFAGVSVPVLQGVQWKAIQGKSTVKLLPLSGNAKLIQKTGSPMGSTPIYVMSKPTNNYVVSKSCNDTEKTISSITHIRPLVAAQKTTQADDISKLVVVRKASPAIAADDTCGDERSKSTVLQDALRASGVTTTDDDIESQISQYTVISKNKIWCGDDTTTTATTTTTVTSTSKPLQLQDTKFLTLEEAVAILGDNSETRALLSQLQKDKDGQLDPQTGVYSSIQQTSSADIFSTAIASADIKLDEEMEVVLEDSSAVVATTTTTEIIDNKSLINNNSSLSGAETNR